MILEVLGFHQEMEQARLAHLEADAHWEDQMKQAGLPPTERLPMGDPAVTIMTESRPRAPPQVRGALRDNDPQRPASERRRLCQQQPEECRVVSSGDLPHR